jgi:hypothetical protein
VTSSFAFIGCRQQLTQVSALFDPRYNVFAGVSHTDPGSKPQRFKSTWISALGVESSIFTIGPNGGLTAMWINFIGRWSYPLSPAAAVSSDATQ